MPADAIDSRRRIGRRDVFAIAATLTLGVLGGACGSRSAATSSDDKRAITVAAASDLRPAFEELGTMFTNATGVPVTFSFGSSGQLREQIINGAPFDVYASASEKFVDEVIDAGRANTASKQIYGYGRIVLVAAKGVTLPTSIESLAAGQYGKIAIANPEHAPYGMAAQQALESAGVYDDVEDSIVYGENVSDTLRLATSGNADIAIVALSLAIAESSDGEADGEYTMIPDSLHEPLRQAMVATLPPGAASASEAALDFIAFVQSEQGREVMARFGFSPPATPDTAGG